MVKLFAIDVPRAVACLMAMAVKQENNHCSGDHWLNLACEVERGQYLSPGQVDRLVQQYPFLMEFRS